jgi:hypothetical protein
LDDAGVLLTVAHRALLSLAAGLSADIQQCYETVQRDGPYVQSKTGLVAHPACKRMDALRRDYVKVLSLLGLRTPAAGEKSSGRTLEDILNG